VALLAMNPPDRPLDALLDCVSHSWVAPQLLATAALANAPNWPSHVEPAILDRGDAKAAAALCGLEAMRCSSQLIELANQDTDYGDEIALGWRDDITTAFDMAGISRSW
jgi:hypothetical protein